MRGFHFGKRAKAPWYYHVGRDLGYIVDGITGLLMEPFRRYGTCINILLCEKTLRWQMNLRKRQRELKELSL